MSSELSKITSSYNNSGVFLQSHVVKQFRDFGWSTDIEYPVAVSPFKTDPTRLHGKHQLPNYRLGVNSGKFIHSIQESQNNFEISERSIDIISAKTLDANTVLKVCVECKKLNPRYTEWCFFQQNQKFEPHVIIKSQKNTGIFTLFHIPETERYGSEIFVQSDRQYNGIGILPSVMTDYGIALTDETLHNKFFKTETTVVNEACRQVIEGTYGLILDVVKSQILNGDVTDYSVTDVFLPMVVTNTQLKLCEYDPSIIDPSSGKLTQEPKYSIIDSILLECNSPKNVQFPEPLFSRVDAKQRRSSSKWYVLVVSTKGLVNFLNQCKILYG